VSVTLKMIRLADEAAKQARLAYMFDANSYTHSALTAALALREEILTFEPEAVRARRPQKNKAAAPKIESAA